MTAKEYVKQIKKIDTQLKNKAFEKKQMEGLGLSADDIIAEINALKDERANIIHTIEQLPEAKYDVLHRVYVQGQTLYEVAADRGMCYSNATTIHGNALSDLDSIIN